MLMQPQLEDEWCWAAVAVSVDLYFNTNSTRTQCSLATQLAGQDCCNNPDACDQPQALQDALSDIGRLNGDPETDSLEFTEIQSAIGACVPLCVRIGWVGGGAHFVAIDGYGSSPAGDPLVHVKDPYFGDFTVNFNDFLSHYLGSGSWTATFRVKE